MRPDQEIRTGREEEARTRRSEQVGRRRPDQEIRTGREEDARPGYRNR
jgi:hypothetical protein